MQLFDYRSTFPCSSADLFGYHARPGAFERLNPPWQPVTLLAPHPGIQNGATVALRIPCGPFDVRWTLQHSDLVEPSHGRAGQFRDTQVRGPFRTWCHTHTMSPLPPTEGTLEQSELTDSIEFSLPGGSIGNWAGGWLIKRQLKALFTYRHLITKNDLSLQRSYSFSTPLKICIAGSSGLVGEALVAFLRTAGHTVLRLVRRTTHAQDEIPWNPAAGEIAGDGLDGLDALIHLGGENIAAGRWTAKRMYRIRESRVASTRILVECLAKLRNPPKSFLCASATGIYGDRDAEVLTEESSKGAGFLAEVGRSWEEEAAKATRLGIRVASLRFGIVLSPRGGALQRMLIPFQLSLGGPLGTGQQFMSWITLDDAVGAIYHTLARTELSGPINMVSPTPCTNLQYTKELGNILSRPTILPVPRTLLRLALGRLADEALLASTRCVPTKLLASGYRFLFPELRDGLAHVLGRGSLRRASV